MVTLEDMRKMIDAQRGISVRELCALVAMHGLLCSKTEDETIIPKILAKSSFDIADAMIAEGEKNG